MKEEGEEEESSKVCEIVPKARYVFHTVPFLLCFFCFTSIFLGFFYFVF
jgi:hypothetical protein